MSSAFTAYRAEETLLEQTRREYLRLEDEEKRLTYDLLACVYGKDDFPQMDALSIFKDRMEAENPDVRVFDLRYVTGKLIKCTDREERLNHSAERRLQWFRDTILPKLQRLLSACISEARNAFASLSHSQAEAVSRRACLLMVKSILPELKYLTASSYPQVSARIPSAG